MKSTENIMMARFANLLAPAQRLSKQPDRTTNEKKPAEAGFFCHNPNTCPSAAVV